MTKKQIASKKDLQPELLRLLTEAIQIIREFIRKPGIRPLRKLYRIIDELTKLVPGQKG